MRPRSSSGRAAAAAGVALLSLALASCSSGSSDPEQKPSATASSSSSDSATDEPVTLRLSVYGGADEVAAYRAIAKAYHEKRPSVTVKVQDSAGQAAAERQLVRDQAGGTPPDLFVSDATALPGLVADQVVRPVDELLEKRGVQFGAEFDRLGLEAFAADSRLQCMPIDVSPYVVYYNTRLYEKTTYATADQPLRPARGWRWSAFVKVAQAMSTGQVKGVALSPDLTTLTPLLRSAGTDVVDDDANPTTLQLSDGPTRSALERILEVARDPELTPTEAQLSQQSALRRFERGKLGMIIGTRALVPTLREQAGLRFDVAPLPVLGTSSTVARVKGLCLARKSENAGAAADFLTYATGRSGSEILAQSGSVVPANLDALHSPSFEQPGRFPTSSTVYSRVMRRAGTMPDPPAWPQVVTATRPLLERLFYAPVLDLDTLLPSIDAVSKAFLDPPSESPSPSSSASASASS